MPAHCSLTVLSQILSDHSTHLSVQTCRPAQSRLFLGNVVVTDLMSVCVPSSFAFFDLRMRDRWSATVDHVCPRIEREIAWGHHDRDGCNDHHHVSSSILVPSRFCSLGMVTWSAIYAIDLVPWLPLAMASESRARAWIDG